MYIFKSAVEFTPLTKFDLHKKFFPCFDKHKLGTIDVDFMIKTYLENFYDKHLKRVIPEWDRYEKYSSKEVYIATEFSVMKEQVKNLVLWQTLYWLLWCLIMVQG